MTAPTQKDWDQIHALRRYGTPMQRECAEVWAEIALSMAVFHEHNEAARESFAKEVAEINARCARRMEEARQRQLRNERQLRRFLAVVLVAIGVIVLVGWFGR